MIRALALAFLAATACTVGVLSLLHYDGQYPSAHVAYQHGQDLVQDKSRHSLDGDSSPGANILPPLADKPLNFLPQDVIEGVEKFVFFIGYPRSGHSIIGSMMDAHPDMVIAHEFMLFRKWQGQQALKSKGRLFNALYRRSLLDATEGSRTMDRDSKGYTLQMEQSWQGRFRKLKVIGDKSGGMVAKLYAENPEDVWRSYQEIVDTVKIPVRVLHVVRNPYDMIATQCLFNASGVLGHKANATANHPYNNSENIIYKIQRLYTHASGINRILHEWGLDVLEIHSADHVRDPKGTMQRICDFLELECPEDYLQQCYDKTFKTLSRSRDLVVWSPETRKMVEEGMREFPFLHRYSFEKDY